MNQIPNKFHFVFGLKPQHEPFHLVYFLCLESCRQINQPAEIYFHYHYEPFGEYWERLRPHLSLNRVDLETFVTDSKRYLNTAEGHLIKQMGLDYAHQSDFIRLKILLDYGGIYADIDTLFVNPLPEFLFEKPFVLGEEPPVETQPGKGPERSLCNAFIMSEPGAVFARFWLNLMYQMFDGTWNRHSCQTPAMLQQQMPNTIFVAPQRYFYKHIWTRKGIADLLENLDPDFSDVYSMHLWAHLWWDEKRSDFSQFHNGLLTERYIREVDTTYNIIARRYLE
ncbi:MAG: glycosyltransferase [Gammaproteobacteria bacterium]